MRVTLLKTVRSQIRKESYSYIEYDYSRGQQYFIEKYRHRILRKSHKGFMIIFDTPNKNLCDKTYQNEIKILSRWIKYKSYETDPGDLALSNY